MQYLSEDTYYDPDDFENLVHIIEGGCSGVAITQLSENDPRLMFTVLMEDDGFYFPSRRDGGPTWSTYWLTDVQESLGRARDWLNENATLALDGFGWVLKS